MTLLDVAEIALPVVGILTAAWLFTSVVYDLFQKDDW